MEVQNGTIPKPGLFLKFDEQANTGELIQSIWIIYFGEFETNEAGDFQVLGPPHSRSVYVSHPDREILLRFKESFLEQRFNTWTKERLTKALVATVWQTGAKLEDVIKQISFS